MIQVELRPIESLDEVLRAEMVAMRDGQSAYDSPFFDLDFAAMIANLRDDVRIALARDDDGLVGFWPIHVRPDKWARPIGGAFSDWHGPVMRPNGVDLSLTLFLKRAGLKGMTANGLQPAGLIAAAGGDVSGAGVAHTPDGADAYRGLMKQLYKKRVKRLRGVERMSIKDFGKVEIKVDDDSAEAFEWLLEMKQQQYEKTGKHNVLGVDWAQAMMRHLFTHKMPRLRGRLSTMRLDGELAGAEFNLLSDKIVHGWITAYDTKFSTYAPGHQLMLAVICDMENTSHVYYDLGAGDQDYKKSYESFQYPIEHTVIRTGLGVRPLASAWGLAEGITSRSGIGVMKSMRQRGDQIFGTEVTTAARLRGLARAVLRKR